MTESQRLPLRVLTKGASDVVYTSWMGGPRTDVAWPRVIEAELHASGHPAEVRCTGLAAQWTKEALKTWQQEALAWSPDVLVLLYGHMETIHLFLPRALERHVNSLDGRPRPGRLFYRKRLLRPTWMVLAKLQRALDQRLPASTIDGRLRRTVEDLRCYIQRVRTVASPLVLVLEIAPSGKPYRNWFPGSVARIDRMNGLLEQLVADFDEPDIRFFHTMSVLGPLVADDEDVAPDGGHFTPPLHRALGEALAAEVATWAEKQPHLDLGNYGPARA